MVGMPQPTPTPTPNPNNVETTMSVVAAAAVLFYSRMLSEMECVVCRMLNVEWRILDFGFGAMAWLAL
jgi:hypothetical protein